MRKLVLKYGWDHLGRSWLAILLRKNSFCNYLLVKLVHKLPNRLKCRFHIWTPKFDLFILDEGGIFSFEFCVRIAVIVNKEMPNFKIGLCIIQAF